MRYEADSIIGTLVLRPYRPSNYTASQKLFHRVKRLKWSALRKSGQICVPSDKLLEKHVFFFISVTN